MTNAIWPTCCTISDKLEGADDVSAVVREIVAETWHAHGRIIFNGNNYSAEWAAEAARRGLPSFKAWWTQPTASSRRRM